MKTAVSIPDETFQQAEQLARKLSISRSLLYTRALAEYVARHGSDTVTDQLDALMDTLQEEPDPFVSEARRRGLARSEW